MDYSEATQKKISIYFACNYLYDRGYSYNQIIEILYEYEEDQALLAYIAEQAQFDKWRTVFNEVQRLTAEGKTHGEIVEQVNYMEEDPEILHFITNTWYQVKATFIENTIEAPGNISYGIRWMIVSVLVVAICIYLEASLFITIVWSISLLVSIVVWLIGINQKKLSKKLKRILEQDYTAFNQII
jgi:hypothetical protein